MSSQDSVDHSLSDGGSNLEKITDCLEDPDAFVRRAALESIPILFKDEELRDLVRKVIPKVMTCLSDSDDAVNRLAGNVLDEFKQEQPTKVQGIREIVSLFGDKEPIRRERAVHSLIWLSKKKEDNYRDDIKQCFSDIEKHFCGSDPDVRKLAATSLLKLSETGLYQEEIKGVASHLVNFMREHKAAIRDLSAETLLGLSKHEPNHEFMKELIERILNYLSNGTDGVSMVAADFLMKLFANENYKNTLKTTIPEMRKKIIPEMRKLLLDGNKNARRTAARLLTTLYEPDSSEVLQPTKYKFFPTTPYTVRENRYQASERSDQKRIIPFQSWKRGDLDRHDDNVIPSWERRIHPDGTPYYIFVGNVQDKEGKDQEFKAVTECVLGLKELEKAAPELYRRYLEREVKISESHPPYQNFGIFLTHLKSGTSGHRSSQSNSNGYHDCLEIGYYFVDFDWNQIFWCEDEANGVRLHKLPEMNSWEQRLSTRFLQHLGLFPNLCPPKIEIANFLRSSLAMSAALTGIDDKIAFKRSLRIDSETCTEILELLDKITESEPTDKITEGKPTTIQHWFDNDGYLNWFLGTVFEDLIINSTYKVNAANAANAKPEHNWAHYALKFASFGIGPMYHSYLLRIWSDRMVTNGEWSVFKDAISSELADTNLLATVLLSANVGFLALNNAPNSAITLSIISTFFAIASIALGTHHAVKNRILNSRQFFHPRAIDAYFSTASQIGINTDSMRTLAFFLSLPSTLLLWSLAHFIAALAGYTFSRQWSIAFGLPPAIMLSSLVILMGATMIFFWRLFHNSDLKDEERLERQR